MNPSGRDEPGEKHAKLFQACLSEGCDGALHVLKQIPWLFVRLLACLSGSILSSSSPEPAGAPCPGEKSSAGGLCFND